MKRILVAATLGAASLVLAACGGSGSSGTSGTAASTAASTPASTAGADAQSTSFMQQNADQVQKWLSAKGTFAPPPTTSPKPEPGKKIALVSCGQVIPSCGLEINAAKQAAEAMGWTATIIDAPNGDPVATGPGIRNAVAQGVDGIFVYYVDCKYIKGPLQAAKAAGIPVINSNGIDCDQAEKGGEKLFTDTVRYNVGDGTYLDWVKQWGSSQVAYDIDKLDGKANIAFFTDNTAQGSIIMADASKAYAEQCDTCSIDLQLFPISDISTKLQAKAESYFLQNQDINAVIPGYTAILTGGLQAAVQSANRDMLVSVTDGLPEGISLIRDGKAQFGTGLSYEWEGYAAIDSLNRLLHGEKVVNSGIGIQLFDQEHNFPTGAAYQAPYDFEALYKKAWGVQ